MRPLLFVLVLSFTSAAAMAGGPIPVLFLGKEGTSSSQHCPVLMRELGRDAIWFDYTADAKEVTPEFVKRFDAVLLDAPREQFPALAEAEASRIVAAGGDTDWSSASVAKGMRERLLTAV